MCTGLEIAAIVGAVAGVGGTAYQISQGEKQREEIETQKGQMAGAAQGRKEELARQQASEAEQEANIRTRDAQRARQRMLAGAAGGRSGTLLTGPMGLTDNAAGPQPGGKTLLGA